MLYNIFELFSKPGDFISLTKLTDTATISAVNQLKADLISSGWWDYLDAIWIGASDGINDTRANQHSYNFKDPSKYRLTYSGNIIQSPGGLYWDGSTGYANTNYLPPNIYNAIIGYYDTYRRSINGGMTIGVSTSSYLSLIIPQNTDGYLYTYCNEGGDTYFTGGNIPGAGLCVSAIDINYGYAFCYINGTLVGGAPNHATPVLPNIPYFLGANNSSGSASYFSITPMRVSFIGSYNAGVGLNQSDLYTAFNTYLAAMDARNNKGTLGTGVTYSINTPTSTNWAAAANGSSATASATNNGSPSSVTDGVISSNGAWWDYPATGQYLEITFASAKLINRVDLYSVQDLYGSPVAITETLTGNNYVISGATVQYWDGSSWITVNTYTGNNLIWKMIRFPSVTTTKIRVTLNAAAGGTTTRVEEIRAYNEIQNHCVVFDGTTNGYIDLRTAATISGTGGALSFWVDSNNNCSLFSNTAYPSSNISEIALYNGSIYVNHDDSSQLNHLIAISGWTNIIINKSGSGTDIYVNGISIFSSLNAQALTFNRIGKGPTGNYNSRMSDVRLFSSTLTSTDIANLTAGLEPVTNSSLHLKMNEGVGAATWDYIM